MITACDPSGALSEARRRYRSLLGGSDDGIDVGEERVRGFIDGVSWIIVFDSWRPRRSGRGGNAPPSQIIVI